MSNSGDVEYDCGSLNFTYDRARTVSATERGPEVSVSFNGKHGFRATAGGELKRDWSYDA